MRFLSCELPPDRKHRDWLAVGINKCLIDEWTLGWINEGYTDGWIAVWMGSEWKRWMEWLTHLPTHHPPPASPSFFLAK